MEANREVAASSSGSGGASENVTDSRLERDEDAPDCAPLDVRFGPPLMTVLVQLLLLLRSLLMLLGANVVPTVAAADSPADAVSTGGCVLGTP